MLGDFNVWVASERDVWRDVRWTHEIGNCNEAGERFLEYCAANNLKSGIPGFRRGKYI